MHILLGLFGLIMFAVIWWYRIKYMSEAANEAVDAIGKVQSKFRRAKIRKKTAVAPVAAINDPLTAAATIIAAIASEDSVLSPDLEQSMRTELEKIETGPKLDEAMVYAKWASEQVATVTSVIDIAGKYLSEKLNEDEKLELIDMVIGAVPAEKRHQAFPDRLKRLRQKLGLLVN
ncbi:MAG: hypothetical protein ACRCU5_10010 [Rhizobiaceae bacterium]